MGSFLDIEARQEKQMTDQPVLAIQRDGRAASGDFNLASRAYDSIRRDILECELKPDAKLPLDELRERYDVGATPLREALMRLTTEGLVVLSQNRGFRVAPVSRADLLDTTRTRIDLGCLALRRSIEEGGDPWEASLVSSFHLLSKQEKFVVIEGRTVMNSEWARLHRQFHSALTNGCGSRWLVNFFEAVSDQTTRYVSLSVRHFGGERHEPEEHREILDAALAGNADRACDLLAAHFRKTCENLLRPGSGLFP